MQGKETIFSVCDKTTLHHDLLRVKMWDKGEIMDKIASLAEKRRNFRSQRVIRQLLALATALVGLTNMISLLSFRPMWRVLLDVWGPDVHHGIARVLLLSGFFLLMLSPALARGKQGAWRVSLVLLLLTLALYLLLLNQMVLVFVTGLLMLLLMSAELHFRARSDPPSVRRGSIALFMGLGVVLLYGLYGVLVLHPQFERRIDHLGIETLLDRAAPWYRLNATHFPFFAGTHLSFFGHVLPMLCLSAVLYGIAQILRPVASTLFPTEQQQQAVANLLRRYGENSISAFALTDDKTYFFTTSGQAVISYVLVGNVAVVAGDPLGPVEEIPQAIEQFLAFCQEQDWRVVFWQVREQLITCYQNAGLHLLKIGEDAVLPTLSFTLAGKAMANVRTSARRAEKAGIQVVFWRGAVQDAAQYAQMEQISRTWLARKGGREMGFSMGRFATVEEQEQLFAVAVDATHQVHAFITLVPIYGRQGWALDLMRRSEQACPGVMEHLLVQTIAHLKTQGARMVSLGLAPLNDCNASEPSLLGKGLEVLAQSTGYPGKQQALCAFKKKFQPCWENRYLVYSSTLTLPKVGLALYRVHQPDGSLLLEGARALKKWGRQERAKQRRPANALVPWSSFLRLF